MKLAKSPLFIVVLLTILSIGFTACSETDEPSEFDNWQQRNEAWLSQIADSAQNNLTDTEQRAAGKWLILKKYSLSGDMTLPTITKENMGNYVYVKILSSGSSKSGSPIYTDSVKVDYRGYLMPTTTYPQGVIFDQSYGSESNQETNQHRSFTVSGVVSGWQTALQYMRIGDRWIIYIPQQLGYGTEASGSIPAYSTLKFDIYLDSFRHKGDKYWIKE